MKEVGNNHSKIINVIISNVASINRKYGSNVFKGSDLIIRVIKNSINNNL